MLRDGVEQRPARRRVPGGEAVAELPLALLIEGHGRFSLHSATRVGRALERFDPLFFEEPVPAGDFAALRSLAASVRVPLAAGERCYSARECSLAIASGGVAVIQPDVIHVGGIAPLLAVASAADAAFVSFAPHNASGPIATAATLPAGSMPSAGMPRSTTC